MTKQEIIDYIMKTPYNTNRAVLNSILEDLDGEGAEGNPDILLKGSFSNLEYANESFSISYTSSTSDLNWPLTAEAASKYPIITELQIGGKIKTLKNGCLEGLTENLKKLTIKDGVENIERDSLEDIGQQLAEDYAEVILGNTIKTIGKDFLSNSKIKQIEFPSSLEEIDTECLSNPPEILESITFNSVNPPIITSIKEYIETYGEETITEDESSLWMIADGTSIFEEYNIIIYVPAKSIDKYKTAYGWRLYSNFYQPIQK